MNKYWLFHSFCEPGTGCCVPGSFSSCPPQSYSLHNAQQLPWLLAGFSSSWFVGWRPSCSAGWQLEATWSSPPQGNVQDGSWPHYSKQAGESVAKTTIAFSNLVAELASHSSHSLEASHKMKPTCQGRRLLQVVNGGGHLGPSQRSGY